MTVKLVLAPGTSNELRRDESEIKSINPVRTHTGTSDFQAKLPLDRSLDDYAQRQDRFNLLIDGDVKFTGYLVNTRHSKSSDSARTTVIGDGIAKRLEETRPNSAVTFSQIALEDAIADYWALTPFDNFSVTSQSTETVATNDQIQSADTTSEWNSVVTLADTDPLVVQNGNLKLAQSSFTTDSSDFSVSGTAFIQDGKYSDGEAEGLQDNGDSFSFTFTPQYRIPESEVKTHFRVDSDGSDGPEISITLNGDTWVALPDGSSFGSVQWDEYADSAPTGNTYQGGDLPAGTQQTLTVEATTSGTSNTIFDVAAPLDGRFTYTFDNDNGGSGGYLDGPELFPDSFQKELDSVTTSFNITEATVATTWNDTTNNQALAVSNDNGQNFLTASNTDTTTQTFNTVGRTAISRFTFSRFGSRTTATPQTGFKGQNVQDYTLEVDGNDLVVIDNLELTRSHFDNLQRLHKYGDFLWTIEHTSDSVSNIPVTSYQEGDETRTAPSSFDNVFSKSPEVQAQNYYNSIYLEGALRSDGTRPSAEVKDSTAINNDGREISPGVLRDPKVTTKAGAVFKARSLLEAALNNNEFVGSITTSPDVIAPGYARPIDFGNGEQNKTIEEVSLSLSGQQARATFVTSLPTDLSQEISNLKVEQQGIGDQV